MKKVLLTAAALLALSPFAAQAMDDHAADAAAPAAQEYTLKDGVTKVSVEGDSVFVIGTDGAKTPAPDGEHETADGVKLTTKDGKVVK